MTKRLYHDNPYLFEFEATVVDLKESDRGTALVLDQTAFYPESGGQSADRGRINDNNIIDVYNGDNDTIVHIIENFNLKPGQTITGQIDSAVRLSNMKKHTGQHILSQALLRVTQAATVSAHLGEVESTIEIDMKDISENALLSAENLTNQIIQKNIPVTTYFLTEDEIAKHNIRRVPNRTGSFRIVDIDSFEVTACGGTHVQNTGEIGLLKIIGTEKIRNRIRITFLTGMEALADYDLKHTATADLSKMLTCHIANLTESVDKIQKQLIHFKRELSLANKSLIPSEIERLKDDAIKISAGHLVLKDYSDKDFSFAKDIVLALGKETGYICFIQTEDKIQIGVSENMDQKASDIAKMIIDKFGGRGGGSQAYAQIGSFPADNIEKIKDKIEDMISQ